MGTVKVTLNNNTLMDITDTTAVASDVASGKYYYAVDGVKTLGTGTGATPRAWSLLATVDVSQVSGSITVNDLDDFTEFMVFTDKVQNASATQSSYMVTINDTELAQGAVSIAKNGTNQYQWAYVFFDGMFWHTQATGATINNNYKAVGNLQSPYFYFENVGKATKFKLGSPATQYVATSGTIKIWGR